ncbi:hypothetical protein [Pararhodobacter sp.]|uniref:hypothetical protein n=1 Tax=Pararhodobacter sp. TaxID=2127056 RepID=UPI002FE07B4F|nr:hypothetical protein [Pseudomonadota bacterium]
MREITKLLSAGALLLGLASPALAATDLRGGGFLTDFVGCESAGWAGNVPITSRWRPAGLPENHATISRVSLFVNSGALNYAFEFQPGEYPEIGEWFSVFATTVFAGAGNPPDVQVRILETSPIEQIAGGATTLFVAFELQNFDGTPGCNARGRVALAVQ